MSRTATKPKQRRHPHRRHRRHQRILRSSMQLMVAEMTAHGPSFITEKIPLNVGLSDEYCEFFILLDNIYIFYYFYIKLINNSNII